MAAFVTYLKRQSPPMQLASDSNGWLTLPNGQRWNPAYCHKFNTHEQRRPWWHRLMGLVRGNHGQ